MLEIQSIHIVNLSSLCLYSTIALVVFIRILNVLHLVTQLEVQSWYSLGIVILFTRAILLLQNIKYDE